jgi:hypothetical protein
VEDTDDPDSPYVLLQRQFEIPDVSEMLHRDARQGVHRSLPVAPVKLTSKTLSIEFDRPKDNRISVTFGMAISDFKKASRVIKITIQIKSGQRPCPDPRKRRFGMNKNHALTGSVSQYKGPCHA